MDCVAPSTAIPMFSPLALFAGSWLRYRTATRYRSRALSAAITVFSPLAHFAGSWLRYRTATHWTQRGPIFCASITMYSPLACFTGSWSRYRTATHWTRRVLSSVLPSLCTHRLPALQVPGQDTGQLPTGRGRCHPLLHNHHVLTPCSLYRFLVKILDSYPLDCVPPLQLSACSHHFPTIQVPG
jgi:hypothetical protein